MPISFKASAVVGPIATVVTLLFIRARSVSIGAFSVSILKMFLALNPLPKTIASIFPEVKS